MARTRSKIRLRDFVRPQLAAGAALPDGLGGAEPALLWQTGEEAEEAYDFEAAQALYREAVRRASEREAAQWTDRYAAFLVERYGQFDEVAAWLDDGEFDPCVALAHRPPLQLADRVALAATEAGHARAEELDESLAREWGRPQSLARVARRFADAGRREEALCLLEDHSDQLTAADPASQLLAELRDDDMHACRLAVAPALAAAEAGDLDTAAALLDGCRALYGGSGAFRGVESVISLAQGRASAAALRQAIEAALDDEDLDGAIKAARALVDLHAHVDSDTYVLANLERRQLHHQRRVDLAAAEEVGAATGEAGGAAAAAALVDRYEAQSLSEAAATRPWLAALIEASAAIGDLARHEDAVRTLCELVSVWPAVRDAGTADADLPDRVEALWRALPEAWQVVGVATQVRARAVAATRRRDAERETRLVETTTALIDAGNLEAAASALNEETASASEAGAGAEIRALRERVAMLLARQSNTERLVNDFEVALEAGRLFAARRAFEALKGLDGPAADQAAPLGLRWHEHAKRSLRGAPVPPFGHRIGEEPIACGVSLGRMIVVQGRLWLAVNLDSQGLAPFLLPEGFALDPRPTARISTFDGRTRLVGFSAGRLVVVDQPPGQPPEIVDARALTELLRPSEQLVQAGFDVAGGWVSLLSHGEGATKGSVSLTRVSLDGLEVRSQERCKPPLAGATPIEGGDGAWLATTTIAARSRRAWAAARFEATGKQAASWDQIELEEPVARFTRAIAWRESQRVFVRYSWHDAFAGDQVYDGPSLLVLRDDRIVFASADLRRRFAPSEPLVLDRAWAFDAVNGRLWFAAVPREDDDQVDALLLGVEATRLRADRPLAIEGARRILAIEAVDDGAAVLARTHDGPLAIARVRRTDGAPTLTVGRLPV